MISGVMFFILLISSAWASTDETALTQAYYLFHADAARGCESCYIPLVLTDVPLPDRRTEGQKGLPEKIVSVIITYERDSIWEIPPGTVTLTEIDPTTRTLRFRGVRYRYQQVPVHEAIRLLKNPNGTIPISRPLLPDRPTESNISTLLKRLAE